MDSIAAIRQSLRAFVWSLFGLLPVLGLVPAIYALICWARVRRRCREWNAAAIYLNWAAVLGVAGILGSALVVLAVGIQIVSSGC